MADRLPIPEHLGGGWTDDPGPLDAAQRKRCGQWRGLIRLRRHTGWGDSQGAGIAPGFAEPWDASEIEECARFARMKRDD